MVIKVNKGRIKKKDHLEVHNIQKEVHIISNSDICKQIKHAGLETKTIMISLDENAELNFV